MGGRRWTQTEINRLYDYAVTCSQQRAAQLLDRTWYEVSRKALSLGIRWRQGCTGLAELARELGCSAMTVRRAVLILFADRPPYYCSGKARRYLLTDDQADRVRAVIKGTRKVRGAQIEAGRRSAASRRGRNVATPD